MMDKIPSAEDPTTSEGVNLSVYGPDET